MKIAFINPPRTIEQKNIWSVVNSVTPPLGLATLAAVLEQHGFPVDVIDAAALELSPSDIMARLEPSLNLIGMTATTPEMGIVSDLARRIRKLLPGAGIVLGGVHPTLFHESLVREGICDMVVRGEGEESVLALARQQPMDSIPGLTWRSTDGRIVVNPDNKSYVVLDQLPFPAFHKLPMKRYRSALGAARRTPSIGLITSRGCPGTCTFCYSGMFGSKVRFMSAERILEHMLFLRNSYGIREISFYDDTFTASRKRVESLCRMLLSQKADLSWSCFARADTIDPELLAVMKQAGCHQIGFGFESADETILKAINKRISTAKIDQAVAWMKAEGIDIRGAFMIGNLGETEETIRRTIDYSIALGIQYAIYNITTPFPGTALFQSATENNLLLHQDWNRYDLAHPVLDLPTVSLTAVQQFYHRAYRDFYLRPSYMFGRILSIRTRYDIMTYLNAFGGILRMLLSRRKGQNV